VLERAPSVKWEVREWALMGKNVSGLAVKFWREKHKLTQSELAARLHLAGWDMERDTITKIEAGNRTVRDDELVKLARVLRCTPNDLVNWKA
jgi:transcriptional regulator with XRE-family HTH domain